MLPRFRMTRSGITRAAFGAAASVCASPFVRSVSYLFSFLSFFSFMNFRLLFSTIQKPVFVPQQRANSTMACKKKRGGGRIAAHTHVRAREGPILICWRITKLIYSLSPKLSFHFVLTATSFPFFFFFAQNP